VECDILNQNEVIFLGCPEIFAVTSSVPVS